MNSVSKRAGEILETLGYPKERVELAKIAGYMHDIGECINIDNHASSGAIITYNSLEKLGMHKEDILDIIMAIGRHEKTDTIINDILAALILADKSDVQKSRVTIKNKLDDKINYAVTNTDLIIDKQTEKIILDLTIDTRICSVLDYFELFMDRIMVCKDAAKYLNVEFEIFINDIRLL